VTGVLARPAFALYLLALATLGFKWLSPLSSFQETAGWTDVFVALAALAWLAERAATRSFPTLRLFHLVLALWLAAALLSVAFADAKGTGARNFLLLCELAALAVLTSQYASERAGLRAIIVVIAAVSLVTAGLAALGLLLFYLGEDTSLIGGYGEQFIRSDYYARVAAGFSTPPLLASFCIFASAVVAREDSPLSPRLTAVIQIALSVVVLFTFSRGAIAFFMAMGIRAAYRRLDARAAMRVAVALVAVSVAVLAALTVGRIHLDPTRPSTITYEVPDPGNRREAFDTGLDTLADHPLTGKGPGTFVSRNRGLPFRAHFTPLNAAATMGLPALAALVFLVVVLWRERRRPTPIATWTGLLALFVDGLAQDVEHFRHVWVMIGLADADRRT
jgi:O-antigen ligase